MFSASTVGIIPASKLGVISTCDLFSHLESPLSATDGCRQAAALGHCVKVAQPSVRHCIAGVKPDDHSEDVSVTFRDAIVRLSSLSVRSIVRMQHQSQLWGQPSTAPPFSYNIWDLHKWGPRSAGVCAGLKPPSLYGTLTGRETSHKLLLMTSGRYRPSSAAQIFTCIVISIRVAPNESLAP